MGQTESEPVLGFLDTRHHTEDATVDRQGGPDTAATVVGWLLALDQCMVSTSEV